MIFTDSHIWMRISNILNYHENHPLLFTQLYFWIFFAIVLGFYSFIYKKNHLRTTWLFLTSLFFYWKSGGFFFTLLVFSTLVDYTIGILLGSTENKKKRLAFVATSIVINLSVLVFFKYSYFFTDIINQLFNSNLKAYNFLAHWANLTTGTNFNIHQIILPVGVSFYTFQTISYSVDVYRKRLEPVKNIVDFGFYVTFFPQLVAGPIVRAAQFVPQIYQKFHITKEDANTALFLILNGLLKKMVISDYISVNFVDRVFDSPLSYSGFENLMAVYGYGIQIYCDFSGYTDIAIGVALLLGYRLPLNFNSPYKAASITDFWRRWHISLSSWLKDYLYIPLGGNRKGKLRTYANLLITMLLGGLWHGAAFRFIIWGGIHGLGLAFHKLWTALFPENKKKKTLFGHFISLFITFQLVHFAWIFFRAPDMTHVGNMLSQIFNNFKPDLVLNMISAYRITFLLIAAAFLIHWLPVNTKDHYRNIFAKTPLWGQALIAAIVVFICYQAKSSDIQPFIYFQF